ncbi:MAG: ATP-binding cassette domain-containing protein, partial [Rhodobacteraceae bacterium]|nr:ATP-binding cassette domain-containing protein [Paracoccaceae bacterium]
EGTSVRAIDPDQRANLIQPIFQDPFSSLNPRKTVAQIVGLPLRLQGTGAEETASRVAGMLELVGLPRRMAGSFPNQMSGGQRQRVAIARALISKPRIIICDEPTSALDVSVQSQILNLLRELQAELGLTYLLISHDLSVVRHMAHSVMVMYLGRIVEHATAETLFNRQRHPYTRALLDTVLSTTPGQGLPDIRLTGEFPNPIAPPAGCPFHPRCHYRQERCQSERPEFTGTGPHRSACLFPLNTP